MNITKGKIDGLLIMEVRKFHDERGYFFESFNLQKFQEAVQSLVNFVQDNISVSRKNVLRGMHFQSPPHSQGKLVSVLKGSVLDVVVDLRKDSPTYGQHESVLLSAENGLQFWIPEGFAHGFLALEEDTVFSYKCTRFYHPQSEQSLQWNDPQLNIDWGVENPIISAKDADNELFSIFVSPF